MNAYNLSGSSSFSNVLDVQTLPDPPTFITGNISNRNNPIWEWVSGGGGNGIYRCQLNNSDLSALTAVISNSSYSPTQPLNDGFHTLYVQEQNLDGYWSESADFTLKIDTIPPKAIILGATETKIMQPNIDFIIGGPEVISYQYKVNDNDWSFETHVDSEVQLTALEIGSYTLSVLGKDRAENWQSIPETINFEVCLNSPQALTGLPLVIQVKKPNPDWDGHITVSLSSTDENGIISDISEIFIANNNEGAYTSVNLDTFLSDFDSYSEINWTVNGQNQLTVTFDTNNHVIIQIPEYDWKGSETITFSTSDTNRLTNLERIRLTPVDDLLEESDLTLIIRMLQLIE